MLLSPIRSPIRSPLYSPLAKGGGAVDPIQAVFTGGKRGFAFEPWDLTTLFQERTGAAATTPVAVGQQIGTIRSVVNGHYATAVSDAKRGVLRQDGGGRYYIETDGVDDCYRIASLTLGTRQYEWLAADQTAGKALVMEHGANSGTSDGHIFYGTSNAPWGVRRTVLHNVLGTPNWADGLHVNERVFSLTDGAYYRDGAQMPNNGGPGPTLAEVDVTTQYNIGARNQASFFFGGKYYGHVLVDGPQPSAAQILAVRQLLAQKSGVTL